MSFLAQLRQQQDSAATTGLQLCYFLQRQTNGVHLALHLATLEHGRVRELDQPYRLQSSHLNLPPPFLTSADVALLRGLRQRAEAWIGRESGLLDFSDAVNFVRSLVATGKCFTAGDRKRRLDWGDSFVSRPCWRIEPDGDQVLDWICPPSTTLWLRGDPCLALEGDRLRPGHCDMAEAASTELLRYTRIRAEQLSQFLVTRAPHWRELELPLPRSLPQQNCLAQLQPVLECESVEDPRTGKIADQLRLCFRYEAAELCCLRNPSDIDSAMQFWHHEVLLRIEPDLVQEQQYRAQLADFLQERLPEASFTPCTSGVWRGGAKNVWQSLLLEHRPDLEAMGFAVHLSPGFRHAYIAVQDWSVEVRRQGEQWHMDLSVTADGRKLDLWDLLEQLRLFNRTTGDDQVELQIAGKTLVLPAGLCRALSDELEDVMAFYGAGAGFPLSQIYRLQSLQALLPEQTRWHGDRSLLDRALQLQKSPVMLDAGASGIQAELRPYQWLGVCWLQHLKLVGFNGLLADDMGLGKTLQTLAHLSLEKKQGGLGAPALIIAPTSLLPNWASELRRFCPHLRAHVVHGGQRHQRWSSGEVDVYITSYPLLVRDLALWQSTPLSWLILDEAQMIKNAQTQVSQAVRQVAARHRLCLSGTPVENHLGELWSLLDFLEPGVLGSQREFKAYYQKPIEQEGHAGRLQQLLTRIGPLLLRRTKNQVAQDLPAKTQVAQVIPLGEEQRRYYERLKRDGWQTLTEQLENTANSGQQQMLVLAALMRLRQACCDPQLLGEVHVPSAKTEYCLEMLQALVDEGRAVLVFSQFTSMLDILAQKLAQLGIGYLLLTGQSRDRAALVEQFQQGRAPVFLISLKAGGVGLNLTRADTVIHFDPWWNAAAEDQATDRAHRIGQTQPVFVYKLIAENTIEEKIAQMQQAKAFFSQQVNQQAQTSGKAFALRLEDLLTLWQDDVNS